MQYRKVQSAPKIMHSKGNKLDQIILDTLETCATIVGSTLGPGGMSVLIERQESGLLPLITKDGVTVFKNIGFSDSTAQSVMEAARDSSVRTASEAGDGTTTATILAHSFVKAVSEYHKRNPTISPQKIARTLEYAFKTTIGPTIKSLSKQVSLGNKEGKDSLLAVAKVSANGDTQLADAVVKCFELVGNDGNVTLLEQNGPSQYVVEKIDGYGISVGYEDCCGPYYQKFVNEPSNQSCLLDNVVVVPYFGKLTDVTVLAQLLDNIVEAAPKDKVVNVVIAATAFAEPVIGTLSVNFSAPTRKVSLYPLVVPLSQSKTAQYDFLCDLAALSGAKVFDPIENPLPAAHINDLGFIKSFEATRFRSNLIIDMDEKAEKRIFDRVDVLEEQFKANTSILDKQLIRERIGKLTGGIAKLIISGSSAGELREKRDRAEDAVCAVRGAILHGVLPAGGWTFLKLSETLKAMNNPVYDEVIIPALMAPVQILFTNSGMTHEETLRIINTLKQSLDSNTVYDLLEGKFVDSFVGGLLDSAPAVYESVKNSISIASLLGTCGGTIVFKRDDDTDRQEAKDARNFMRDVQSGETIEDF